MGKLDELLAVLDLEPVGRGAASWRRTSSPGAAGWSSEGQLLAQTIVAGATVDPTKDVQSVHTVFARGGALDQPLDIEVEPMHVGRALASATVTVRQGERLCTRSLVLLSAVEPDLIRHGAEPPAVGRPEDAVPSAARRGLLGDPGGRRSRPRRPRRGGAGRAVRVGRFPGAEATGVLGQALLSYATDGFLIGTAMRPHEGVGQSMAHVSISTSVLCHTLSFHEPVDAGDWHLLAHESPYAGRGRSYGRADIFTEDGRLVASFVQDNMVRAFPEGQGPPAGDGRSSDRRSAPVA